MEAKLKKNRARHNLERRNKSLRPRLSVHRTARHVYAQVIDDAQGRTVAAYSTKVKGWTGKSWDVAAAEKVGAEVAKLALAAKVKDVVFDRGSYRYHGRVKALADGARKAGLNF